MISSTAKYIRHWPFVRRSHRSPVDCPHKGHWQAALTFSLICAWTGGWANSRNTGDLRFRRAHYEVTVMDYGVAGVLAASLSLKDRPSMLSIQRRAYQSQKNERQAAWLSDLFLTKPMIEPAYTTHTSDIHRNDNTSTIIVQKIYYKIWLYIQTTYA